MLHIVSTKHMIVRRDISARRNEGTYHHFAHALGISVLNAAWRALSGNLSLLTAVDRSFTQTRTPKTWFSAREATRHRPKGTT